MMAAYVTNSFEDAVHAGLRAQRLPPACDVFIDFAEGDARLDGLPKGLTRQQRWARTKHQRGSPNQQGVPGVRKGLSGIENRKKGDRSYGEAECKPKREKGWMASKCPGLKSEVFLSLPLFLCPFHWVFCPSKPVAVRVGQLTSWLVVTWHGASFFPREGCICLFSTTSTVPWLLRGGRGRIRTRDLRLRRPMHYPAVLHAQPLLDRCPSR